MAAPDDEDDEYLDPDEGHTQEEIAAYLLSQFVEVIRPDADKKEVPNSQAGYIITEDGTIYVLLKPYWHGIVRACLEAATLHEQPIDVEDGDPGEVLKLSKDVYNMSVLKFQRFKGRGVYQALAPGAHMGMYWSLPRSIITPEARAAVVKCMAATDVNLADKIATNSGDLTMRRALESAAYEDTYEPQLGQKSRSQFIYEKTGKKHKVSKYDD